LLVRRTTPAEFGGIVKDEIASWAALIKAAGIPPQDP